MSRRFRDEGGDTPRTDALAISNEKEDILVAHNDLLDHSRMLEREFAAASSYAVKLQEAAEEVINDDALLSVAGWYPSLAKLRGVIDRAALAKNPNGGAHESDIQRSPAQAAQDDDAAGGDSAGAREVELNEHMPLIDLACETVMAETDEETRQRAADEGVDIKANAERFRQSVRLHQGAEMSNTPRTDAVAAMRDYHAGSPSSGAYAALLQLAEALELDLAIEREQHDASMRVANSEADRWKHAFEVANTKDHEAIAADRAVERALGRAEGIPAGWKLVPEIPSREMSEVYKRHHRDAILDEHLTEQQQDERQTAAWLLGFERAVADGYTELHDQRLIAMAYEMALGDAVVGYEVKMLNEPSRFFRDQAEARAFCASLNGMHYPERVTARTEHLFMPGADPGKCLFCGVPVESHSSFNVTEPK